MTHTWDESTPYCTRCGIQKGWHAEECLATSNCIAFWPHFAKRRLLHIEGKMIEAGTLTGADGKGKIIVEAFPRETI